MPADSQTFESYRRLLFSIAYRMLGSVMEAEDLVQETYLRYEKVAQEEVQSPKAYLSAVITRLCLDQLKSAKTQRESYVGTWLPEPLLTAPSPGALVGEWETMSMAFMVLLESLSPVERAVFLLREVFDYPYAEIAHMVGKGEANCRQYHRRAKQYLLERRPRFEPSRDEQEKLLHSFLVAVGTGDVEGLTHQLAEDAIIYADGGGKAPAARQPVVGREAVIRVLRGGMKLVPENVRLEIAEINGAPAIIAWSGDAPYAVFNLTIAQGLIQSLQIILNPDKLRPLSRQRQKP